MSSVLTMQQPLARLDDDAWEDLLNFIDEVRKEFDETAKKLPTLFPDSTKGLKPEGDYSTSPKVWENKADFDAKIVTFAKAVTDAKGKIKDVDTLKAQLGAIGKTCGGCHETYRLKNT